MVVVDEFGHPPTDVDIIIYKGILFQIRYFWWKFGLADRNIWLGWCHCKPANPLRTPPPVLLFGPILRSPEFPVYPIDGLPWTSSSCVCTTIGSWKYVSPCQKQTTTWTCHHWRNYKKGDVQFDSYRWLHPYNIFLVVVSWLVLVLLLVTHINKRNQHTEYIYI